ncbi:MAG: UDP-2,3-diacylglucosamine diphosphatase [Bacteroidota bacterium]|nr:UDP-2,3-diacylglucosamine diphosphatase [Bacteroidota bacterium]MDP4241398.1 UDP-2,3-diacylglucosamine diphosphatase [Bacteroidota bacterium]MDP4287321.1 UDP-2,3-diacylglucosamine diphosphatase [Bacteroidota bacterium]
MRYYFISDVHLGYGPREEDRAREGRLLTLLDKILDEAIRGEAGGVFVVGDLFDSWFDFAHVIPRRHVRTIAALARIADRVPVEYLMGNHDFGHRDFFEEELSIPLHRMDIRRELLGKRFYIAHGDGKAANDTGYLFLRKLLRSPFAQAAYKIIHPDLGIPFAEWISGRSRLHTDARNALKKYDGLRQFAENILMNREADYVVMGHKHDPAIISAHGGTYINLGDWLRSYTYGVFDEAGFRIENAP